MFGAITKLRSIKRETNEDSINNHILKTVGSLKSKQLKECLNNLIKTNKLENKPYSGKE